MPRYARNDAHAFSLAEILITLVIIGVIAAITVPSLINKTNNQEYVSRLKKVYSVLAQATNQIIAEEGTPRADKGGWASSTLNVYSLYKKKLIDAQDCSDAKGCVLQGKLKYLDNSGTTATDFSQENISFRKLVLNDGTQVVFDEINGECNATSMQDTDICAFLFVDVNGSRKPNTLGRDVFYFIIKEKGLYPRGCADGYCNGPENAKGVGCGCKVLREGAMNY